MKMQSRTLICWRNDLNRQLLLWRQEGDASCTSHCSELSSRLSLANMQQTETSSRQQANQSSGAIESIWRIIPLVSNWWDTIQVPIDACILFILLIPTLRASSVSSESASAKSGRRTDGIISACFMTTTPQQVCWNQQQQMKACSRRSFHHATNNTFPKLQLVWGCHPRLQSIVRGGVYYSISSTIVMMIHVTGNRRAGYFWSLMVLQILLIGKLLAA